MACILGTKHPLNTIKKHCEVHILLILSLDNLVIIYQLMVRTKLSYNDTSHETPENYMTYYNTFISDILLIGVGTIHCR